MIKTAVKYGLVCGTISIATLFGSSFFLQNPIGESGIISAIILAIFITFGIRDFKFNQNQGLLQFWQGISIGFITYVMSATLLAGGVLGLINYKPETKHEVLQEQITKWEKAKDETIENRGEEYYENYLSQLKNATDTDIAYAIFLKQIGIGVILTFAIALALRKNLK